MIVNESVRAVAPLDRRSSVQRPRGESSFFTQVVDGGSDLLAIASELAIASQLLEFLHQNFSDFLGIFRHALLRVLAVARGFGAGFRRLLLCHLLA